VRGQKQKGKNTAGVTQQRSLTREMKRNGEKKMELFGVREGDLPCRRNSKQRGGGKRKVAVGCEKEGNRFCTRQRFHSRKSRITRRVDDFTCKDPGKGK